MGASKWEQAAPLSPPSTPFLRRQGLLAAGMEWRAIKNTENTTPRSSLHYPNRDLRLAPSSQHQRHTGQVSNFDFEPFHGISIHSILFSISNPMDTFDMDTV